MKPNFALSMSFDGLRLMHRVPGGWHLVGQVALDDEDVTGALARLKAAALMLEPDGLSTKLLVPNDQIKYLALDTTRTEESDVWAALDGATPYPVDDLSYDFAKGGGRTYVAAVAKETLAEAEQFAAEHGFNPVCFAAIPEPFTYVGEAFFGAVDGHTAQRDDEPVIVIGQSDVMAAQTADATPIAADTDPEPDPAPLFEPTEDDVVAANEQDTDDTTADIAPDPEETAPDDIPVTENPADAEPPEVPAPPEPMFASRNSADRSVDVPAAPTPEPRTPPKSPLFPKTRAEPTFGRPSLAVPQGAENDGMPPVPAPDRDDTDTPATQPITTDAPEADMAPAVTGDAATALPIDAAASLMVEPAQNATPEPAPKSRSGALGGMFASRRMSGNDATTDPAKPTGKAEKTVFGGRKKDAARPKVGGKPRFLGLILTAVLLLFLLALAAFAALSEDGVARWFGFATSDTQIAAEPIPDGTAPEVAVQPPTAATPDPVPQIIAAPAEPLTPPEGAQILTPENATRIYAATGVWQRAPRIPVAPRDTSLENMTLDVAIRPVTRVPSSPLASASSVAGDAVIATPIDPPAPSVTFDFDADGLIVATEQGAVTPDGTLVIAGSPALNPPTRPGTVAPVITPQDQIAAVIPEEAAPLPDAPDGVIVIAGRPAITPPVRVAPVVPVAPEATPEPTPEPTPEAIATDTPAVIAPDGLLVIAGSPPVLPPARPGTELLPVSVAPTPDTIALAPSPSLAAPITGTPVVPLIDTPPAIVDAPDEIVPEGLNVISGAPPVLPPARPGTLAPQIAAVSETPPQNDEKIETLNNDVSAALTLGTAQTPTPDTPRPLLRPAAAAETAAQQAAAAVAAANTPVLGALTRDQALAFRPLVRPAGLAPARLPSSQPDPAVAQAALQALAPQSPTLQIAPEIAAAVQAAANRPNPIVNPTPQAVALSERPDLRPRNMARIVERAAAAQQRATTQVAAVAPRTVAPSGPTGNAVARNATLDNAINLREVNLIGIYGGSNDRRALVRLANGRYQRVTVGDRLDGGRVSAISAGVLRYTKRGREITLQVAG